MSQVVNEAEADVVCLGLGIMSGVIAAELTQAGYNVVGITKGPYWDYAKDFAPLKYDEWGIGMMRKFDSPLPMQSTTIRNTSDQFALPVRRYTMPIQYHALGHGVGGAGQHYGGQMGRQGPQWYQMKTMVESKYGDAFLQSVNPHSDLEDWPVSYVEYEPYYEEWEKAMGVTGTNQGPLVPMQSQFPLPPHPSTPVAETFMAAAEALGYNPYPHVTALASTPYVNQYGVQVNECAYDGWCGGPCDYACETGAKANSAYRTIPAAIKTGKFTTVLNSYIFRMDTDPATGNVTAVRYYDAEGVVHVQPGKVFFNGLWGYNIIRSMLLSGVGTAYDPVTTTGSLGRGLTNGYSPYMGTTVSGTLPTGGNAYPAGNAYGGAYTMYDLMDDNFDHTGLNFIGGSQVPVGIYPGSGPGNITFAGSVGPTSFGSQFKAGVKNKYLLNKTTVSFQPFAPDLPTTDHYADLDPHYTDMFGDPVARLTFDWTDNVYNGATYMVTMYEPILEKMGCTDITTTPVVPPGSAHNDWWGHHLRGGARIGVDPATSVFNRWNQCWEAENLFGAGEITNTTGDTVPSGTHVAGPQSYVAAEGIQKYLESPGLLT